MPPVRRSKKPARQRVEGLCGHWCYQWPQVFNESNPAYRIPLVLCDECGEWVEMLPSDVMPGQLSLFDLDETD